MSYFDEISNIWNIVKESFKKTLPEEAVDLWFGGLNIESYENNEIVFSITSEFKYNILNEKYISQIEKKFAELGFDVKVKLIFTGTQIDAKKISDQMIYSEIGNNRSNISSKNDEIFEEDYLPYNNFEYTFDNFVVGNTNKFAHAACIAVARNQAAMDYNPLFIYGPSGLGKTHLMYAVTNEIKKKKPDLKVLYIKGENFTNQLIESLSKHEMDNFRNKYRKCDILLIDDIQFIAGKNSTQEEFFHTFNALYDDHKQIILTSDRPPKDIKTLEDRLKTRFEWGLIADIQPPDYELRRAIFKTKAEQGNVIIPDEVLDFLAENLRSNIRQIEGAIKKLGALSFLSGKKVTMELARGCISELLGGAEPQSVTVEKIFSMVCKKYNVTKESLTGPKRTKDIAMARHISIYLIRNITEMSLPNISKIFERDHTTIMSSISTVERRTISEPLFNIEINEMIKEITGK